MNNKNYASSDLRKKVFDEEFYKRLKPEYKSKDYYSGPQRRPEGETVPYISGKNKDILLRGLREKILNDTGPRSLYFDKTITKDNLKEKVNAIIDKEIRENKDFKERCIERPEKKNGG